jgi:hypothetical protein
MVIRSLPVAALLLGLTAFPALAQTRPAEAAPDAAAVRTLEQNRRVSVGLPPAATPPAAEARAVPPRRLALAAQR